MPHKLQPTVPIHVHVWCWGRRGGGPLYALNLAQALAGIPDVRVSLGMSRQCELAEAAHATGLPVHWASTYVGPWSFLLQSLLLPLKRRRLRRDVAEMGADVVISAMPHVWSWFLAPAVRAAGARFISVIHDGRRHPGEFNPFFAARLAREIAVADGVVVPSDHVKGLVLADNGLAAGAVRVIPLGPFQYSPPRPRPFPSGRPFHFMFFGRILAYKGLDILLDAYALLRARHPAVRLSIVGNGDLTPFRDKLAALPDVEVVNRWIAEEEVGGFFDAADALVAPYVEASQSGAIVAAMGSGIPTVATPVGGLAEQVADGQTGIVASAITAPAFAEAMARLLTPATYQHCVAGVGAHNAQTFSWAQIGTAFAGYCRDLVKGAPPV